MTRPALSVIHFPILKTTQNIAYDYLQLFLGALRVQNGATLNNALR